MASNYSIIVDVDFQKGEVEQKLSNVVRNFDSLTKATGKATSAAEDLNLTFNVANEMFRTSIDLINGFVDQVRELDDAIVEFRKVSDLSGDSLEDYIQKLSKMGTEVARTGKLNQFEPVCTDGKCA